MYIEYGNSRNITSNDRDETAMVLRKLYENSENEFWISIDENSRFPCIAILVKNDISWIHYFPEENCAGFSSLNTFGGVYETIHCVINGNEYEISSENGVPFAIAISAVLQFFDSHALPDIITWEKLWR
jgi:hypothetical protein